MNKNNIRKHSNTIKGIYGIDYNENGKFFFKNRINKEELSIKVFDKISFKVSKPVITDDKIQYTFYDFDEDLYENTLYDTLYFKGKYWSKKKNWFSSFKKDMINNEIMMKMSETKSNKFYYERIDRIKESYKHSRNKNVLIEVEKFLKSIDIFTFRTHISNGDLTDTNLCLNGKMCDMECFGYNVILCDLAIFFMSIIYGRWIYPKYNPNAYTFRKNKIENPVFGINRKQLYMLKNILKLVKPYEFIYFKKFLIMRLVTPITLDKMSLDDRVIVDDLIEIVSKSTIDNLIKNLIVYNRYYKMFKMRNRVLSLELENNKVYSN